MGRVKLFEVFGWYGNHKFSTGVWEAESREEALEMAQDYGASCGWDGCCEPEHWTADAVT